MTVSAQQEHTMDQLL